MKSPPYIIDKRKNPRWQSVLEACIRELRQRAEEGGVMVVLSTVLRTLDQNAKMWPMLNDFADQVLWPIDGVPILLADHDWKALLTAAFERELRMAPGLHGGTVMLGASTSQYDKQKMSEFIEFMYAEGTERNVRWSERSKDHFERYSRVRF